MSSAYYHAEALILKKMPFGEADFLMRVICKDFGKIDILAKGARKVAAKLNAHLDILNLVRISFVKNGERIPTLIDIDGIAQFDDWFLDMDHMELVGKMLRTVDVVIPAGSPDIELYILVRDAFRVMPTEKLLEYGMLFLSRLLAHEGYGEKFDLDTLPRELAEPIIQIWPTLKN